MKKLVIALLSVILVIAALKPFVVVSMDDYGVAVSTRTDVHERFERLVVWQYDR